MPEAAPALQPLTVDCDTSLIAPLYATSGSPSLAFLSNLLAQPSCYAWVLSRDEAPVAAIWYQCVAGRAELIDLRVSVSCRRQGLGKQLLWATLGALQGATRLDLEVRDSNTAARALYRALSFQETGRRRDYYALDDGREDAVLMTLELSSRAWPKGTDARLSHQVAWHGAAPDV